MSNTLRYKYAPASERGEDWRADANCGNEDPELFFPNGTGVAAREQIREAKAVCGACLARTACLDYAISANEQYGIWGGTTEGERSAMRRKALRTRSMGRAATGRA